MSRSAGLIASSSLSISADLTLSSPLFDAPGLISSLKLSDSKFRGLVVLYSKIGANIEGWRLGKLIGILQALRCLVKH